MSFNMKMSAMLVTFLAATIAFSIGVAGMSQTNPWVWAISVASFAAVAGLVAVRLVSRW